MAFEIGQEFLQVSSDGELFVVAALGEGTHVFNGEKIVPKKDKPRRGRKPKGEINSDVSEKS